MESEEGATKVMRDCFAFAVAFLRSVIAAETGTPSRPIRFKTIPDGDLSMYVFPRFGQLA